jgi:hypothetical protein
MKKAGTFTPSLLFCDRENSEWSWEAEMKRCIYLLSSFFRQNNLLLTDVTHMMMLDSLTICNCSGGCNCASYSVQNFVFIWKCLSQRHRVRRIFSLHLCEKLTFIVTIQLHSIFAHIWSSRIAPVCFKAQVSEYARIRNERIWSAPQEVPLGCTSEQLQSE